MTLSRPDPGRLGSRVEDPKRSVVGEGYTTRVWCVRNARGPRFNRVDVHQTGSCSERGGPLRIALSDGSCPPLPSAIGLLQSARLREGRAALSAGSVLRQALIGGVCCRSRKVTDERRRQPGAASEDHQQLRRKVQRPRQDVVSLATVVSSIALPRGSPEEEICGARCSAPTLIPEHNASTTGNPRVATTVGEANP